MVDSTSIVAFQDFLKVEKNASPLTIENYLRDLRQFHDFLNREHISEYRQVTHSTIRVFLTELYEQKLTRRTVSRKLSSLRSFYNFLEREGLIEQNPFQYVATPKIDKKIPDFFYEEELIKLFEVEDITTPLGQRNQAILELLYATGIRVSELIKIKEHDLDFSMNAVLVHGKGNKERYVPFGSFARQALMQYINEGRTPLLDNGDETNLVFLNHRGKPLTDRGVRYILNELIKKASLTSTIHPHKIRHTFATHMLNEGADLRSVQEMLGHASLSTTQQYTHVTKDYLQNIYKNAHPRS